MADLSITAANVVPTAGTVPGPTLYAAVSIVAGDALYTDTSVTPSVYRKALSVGALNIASCVFSGIAMNTAAVGQPVQAATGQITVAASGLTAGAEYVLSANAGKITTDAVAAGNNVVTVGVAANATDINVQPRNWGVLHG